MSRSWSQWLGVDEETQKLKAEQKAEAKAAKQALAVAELRALFDSEEGRLCGKQLAQGERELCEARPKAQRAASALSAGRAHCPDAEKLQRAKRRFLLPPCRCCCSNHLPRGRHTIANRSSLSALRPPHPRARRAPPHHVTTPPPNSSPPPSPTPKAASSAATAPPTCSSPTPTSAAGSSRATGTSPSPTSCWSTTARGATATAPRGMWRRTACARRSTTTRCSCR